MGLSCVCARVKRLFGKINEVKLSSEGMTTIVTKVNVLRMEVDQL